LAAFAASGWCVSSSRCDGDGQGEKENGNNNNGNGSRMLLMGIPKKGRLYEKITTLLKGAGIEYTRPERVDIAKCTNLPLQLVFLPAADIAKYVGEGEVDIGITGEDVVAESDVDVEVLVKLGIGKCRLSVQGPVGKFSKPEELAGKRIATSFPFLTKRFFDDLDPDLGPSTRVKVISGSVEAAVGLGLADAVVDLVETGTTMKAAGLEEVAVVMPTQTVLVANPHTSKHDLVETIRKRIAGYLTADAYLMVAYNVHRDNLDRCKVITPGKNSPTVSPLDRNDWCGVSALVPKKQAPSCMDDLEANGAKDILLFPLVSSRMGD